MGIDENAVPASKRNRQTEAMPFLVRNPVHSGDVSEPARKVAPSYRSTGDAIGGRSCHPMSLRYPDDGNEFRQGGGRGQQLAATFRHGKLRPDGARPTIPGTEPFWGGNCRPSLPPRANLQKPMAFSTRSGGVAGGRRRGTAYL